MSTLKSCEHYQKLMMKRVDGEISPDEAGQLDAHVQSCETCSHELQAFQNLKSEAREMKKHLLPEMAWEEYWRQLYNRMERGIGWILFSVGAILLIGFGMYEAVSELLRDSETPAIVRYGILTLLAGAVLLLVSVLREKLMVRRHDKYKEIQR